MRGAGLLRVVAIGVQEAEGNPTKALYEPAEGQPLVPMTRHTGVQVFGHRVLLHKVRVEAQLLGRIIVMLNTRQQTARRLKGDISSSCGGGIWAGVLLFFFFFFMDL